jgi:hypothetical protein
MVFNNVPNDRTLDGAPVTSYKQCSPGRRQKIDSPQMKTQIQDLR